MQLFCHTIFNSSTGMGKLITLNLSFRLRTGLHEAGVLHILEQYPTEMGQLFTKTNVVLTANIMIQLFIPTDHSPRGHIKFKKETETVGYWRDWLLEIEGKYLSPAYLIMTYLFCT